MILVLGDICTFTAAFIFFVFGIVYFYKSRSAKNHCNTIQKKLEEVNRESQILIFALMRGAGGGAVAVSIITALLQLQYSKRAESWIPAAIVIVDMLFYLPSLNAMLLVKRHTTIKPPVFILSFAILLITVGYFLNIEITN